MAISALYSSKKRRPLLSPSKKRALEIKKKLLKKRGLGPKKSSKVKSEDAKKIKICREKNAYKHSSVDANSSAMLRAEEVQANLESDFPSFIKYMLPSHVSGGFWLGFPKKFCNSHLPKHDDTIILVDENEEEHDTKYLVEKTGLSGGWRGFSIAHSLLEGDVLVFQLIEPSKFKVYVVRANSLTELDGAISLLNLDSCARPIKSDQVDNTEICEAKEEKHLEPAVTKTHQDVIQPEVALIQNSDQYGNESDNGSDIEEGITFSESIVDFKDVNDFSGFNILIDGLIIDSEIPPHIQSKYYNLCCGQNSFLHGHLFPGLNCKLAAGIITETVNIADAIRASKISTPRGYLETWDTTLKGLECLGMKVGFLRDRLNKLVSMSAESETILEAKGNELATAKEELKNLEVKISNVKEAIRNLDSEIEALSSFKLKFKALAAAPW